MAETTAVPPADANAANASASMIDPPATSSQI
jgi:hypothetical protein